METHGAHSRMTKVSAANPGKQAAPRERKKGYTRAVPADGKTPRRPPRERADKRVVDAGLAESRTRAQALILAGQVVIGDHAVAKPGDLVDADAEVRLKGDGLPYVSRGGLKLAHALDHFALDVRGLSALDVGASTGGFTDVLLPRG